MKFIKNFIKDNLSEIIVDYLYTSNVKNMEYMFYNNYASAIEVRNFDTKKVETMKGMFWNCHNITEIHTYRFDTSLVTNFDNMFTNCSNINELNLAEFNTLNCDNNFKDMFSGCGRITVIINDNITKIENLLEILIKSDANIRFVK